MPEPTIVSPNAEMVTAYGGAGATVSTGYVTPQAMSSLGAIVCLHHAWAAIAIHARMMRASHQVDFMDAVSVACASLQCYYVAAA